jgi:hypothetical protein
MSMANAPGRLEAQTICKTVMVQIRNFVLYGHSLDWFTVSLLRRDVTQAAEQAHPILLRENCIPDLIDFVEQHIPSGMFATQAEIELWNAHQGLTGASEEQKMWFWMVSSWWNPKKAPVRPPQAIPLVA